MRWFSHPGMKRSSQGEIQSGQQHCPRLEGPGVITLSKTPGEVTDKVWALLGGRWEALSTQTHCFTFFMLIALSGFGVALHHKLKVSR